MGEDDDDGHQPDRGRTRGMGEGGHGLMSRKTSSKQSTLLVGPRRTPGSFHLSCPFSLTFTVLKVSPGQ